MNIAVFCGHPAHYHYYKYTAQQLAAEGHSVFFIIKEKDVLRQLLDGDGQSYTVIGKRRGNGKWAMLKALVSSEWLMVRALKRQHIDVLMGCPLSFSARIFTKTKVVSLGEDDAAIVPMYAKMVYPFSHVILSPKECDNGKWNKKTVHYDGYMKLAYLHPSRFQPSMEKVAENGVDMSRPYFLLRFASLHAHHDKGIGGFSTEVAQRVIEMLKPHGNVYITSERPLEPQFEPYRLHGSPNDIHHIMAYASIYLGDSQSMAVEAAMLGVPSLRFNDFAGKIGVLEALEHTYGLTCAIKSSEPQKLYDKLEEWLRTDNLRETFQQRRQKMLAEKIDVTAFYTWFIEQYPESVRMMKENPDCQFRFQ